MTISNGDFQGNDPTWDLGVFKKKTLILALGLFALYAIETWIIDFDQCKPTNPDWVEVSFLCYALPFILLTYSAVLLSKVFAYFNDYVKFKIEYYEKYIDKVLLNFCLFYLSIAYIFTLHNWLFLC